MTDTERIQAIIEALEALTTRVTAAEGDINTLEYDVASNYNTLSSSINTINGEIDDLEQEDSDIHDEIHSGNNTLSGSIAGVRSDLDDTTEGHVLLEGTVDTLSDTVTANKNYQDEENIALHREIHALGNTVIDHYTEQTSSLYNMTQYLNNIPQSVLISESDYENLPSVQAGVYYYIYEEE